MNRCCSSVFKISWLTCALFLAACHSRKFNDSESVDTVFARVAAVDFQRQFLLSNNRFDRITPTGEKLFTAAKAWEVAQEQQATVFAQPGQSLNNIFRVLEMAGLHSYSVPSLGKFLENLGRRGSVVIELPRNTRSIARIIEDHFDGALPVGTLIIGCLQRNCSSAGGDGQVGLLGDLSNTNALHLWHNNWFRPENRPWRKYMIPLAWYQAGFLNRWMSTPWISRIFDTHGRLVDLKVELPEINDTDPSNAFLALIILPEIMQEMKTHQSVTTDGVGAVMPFRKRSSSRSANLVALPTGFLTHNCGNLQTNTSLSAILREYPGGKIICHPLPGSDAELIGVERNWSRIRTVCPDGKNIEGFALSVLLMSRCGK